MLINGCSDKLLQTYSGGVMHFPYGRNVDLFHIVNAPQKHTKCKKLDIKGPKLCSSAYMK